MRSAVKILGVLAALANTLSAQTPDQIVDTYIAEANSLAGQLELITDANTAQAAAGALPYRVSRVNAALAAVKPLYGNPGAQTALANKSSAMSAAQTRLANEQTRLLTGDCALEGTIKSTNGAAVSPTIANHAAVPLRYQWLDYNGVRTGGGILQPHESAVLQTYTTHPFVLTDPQGRCVRILTFPQNGAVSVSELLAPTVGLHLTKLQK